MEEIVVKISVRTREALRNLVDMLKVEGENFDEQMFNLATKIFVGRSEMQEPERRRSPNGLRKKRMQIEITRDVADELKDLYSKLYPYYEWKSWDWFLSDIIDRVKDTIGEEHLEVKTFSGDQPFIESAEVAAAENSLENGGRGTQDGGS